jgi:hypothetical protein
VVVPGTVSRATDGGLAVDTGDGWSFQLDAKTVPDGVCDLAVTVSDMRENIGPRSCRITIPDQSGWFGS